MIAEMDFLRKIYIFQDLNDQDLEFVAQIMSPCEFAQDNVIMQEGEPGDVMYVLSRGSIQIHKALTMKFGEDDYRETEKTLIVLYAEDHQVVGEMALITSAPRSATVTAREESVLYQISREDFLNLARAKPRLGFNVTFRLAELVSTRLKKSSEDIIRLTTALSIALSH
jgi:CRP/FNR family cyclic AMP-dependent transcriptional regulator